MMTEILEPTSRTQSADQAVLEVKGLDVDIRTPKGIVRVVSQVGFSARRGKTLALLGNLAAVNR
ncbi:hypothetical protein [Glutamicibacter sp. M10]|uniref:hypothetical protein n=1 Tax=Glutamicibacter sp. M10 TaxID=3023076 RepID=UPI0029056ADA|nr:hypothetical protein [Glutamicibacter sp. M10]